MQTKQIKPPKEPRKGMVLVYTGAGKGKTTAALGLILRAWGRNFQTCVIQFIKASTGRWGEVKAARDLAIEWHTIGDGFTWKSRNMEETARHAVNGWLLAQQKISSDAYDLVILDEFTYPLHFGWLNTGEVISWLKENKPAPLHLVITGRYAPTELIDYADLVTEMQEIKHPFTQGIKATPGIDF